MHTGGATGQRATFLMTRKEWIEAMKDEWSFHRRHPEMFIPWALMLWALITAIAEEMK